jgi:sulfatase modifying factor 1
MTNASERRARHQTGRVVWLAMGVMATSCGYPDLPLLQSLSCRDLAATCGTAANPNDDCCRAATVTGGTFYRTYDDVEFKDMRFPATVSTFVLDQYEVTVGRFRAFINAGLGTAARPPAARAGAHPNLTGSGWDDAWNTSLVADTAALIAAVKVQCMPDVGQTQTLPTWTDTPGGNENKPMNCVTWYEAMAFCIWDGGYLPTEAEWNYAASGGSEQRVYPWSNPAISTNIDCKHANYKINNPSGTFCVNGTTGGTDQVGHTSPMGDGKWGHSDLAGNVWEWALDWYTETYPIPCNDCANLDIPYQRVIRGGSFNSSPPNLRAGHRDYFPPDMRYDFIGVRCARTP